MALAAALSILLVVALTNGQFTPPLTSPGCDDPIVQAGHSYLAHETYCQLFYQCDMGRTRWTQACGPGTLYNPTLSVCVATAQGKCDIWRECNATYSGYKYPAVCCDEYFNCTGSGYQWNKCPDGTRFDMRNGVCSVNAVCSDHERCERAGTGNAQTWHCYDFPDAAGNPCVYTTRFAGFEITNRPCPYGTSFNQTACQCSSFSSQCTANAGMAANKAEDPLCRASLRLDFDVYPLQATSDKLSSGPGTVLPYTFQTLGLTINNGRATLRTDPITGGVPYFYNYFLNANRLGMPLAISVVFRLDVTPTTPTVITLITNNYNDICAPTLEANITYSANQFRLNVMAIGATDLAVNNQARMTGTIEGAITMTGTNFLEVLLMFNGQLSAQLIDRGPIGTTTNGNFVNINPTGRIGDFLATNRCGFVVGKGLTGTIDRFYVYEGCGDFNRLRRV